MKLNEIIMAVALSFPIAPALAGTAEHTESAEPSKMHIVEVTEAASVESKEHYFQNFAAILQETECSVPVAGGKQAGMRDFFENSKKEKAAVEYAKSIIEKARNLDSEKLTPLELAFAAVDLIRKDLSITDGFGKYVPDSKMQLKFSISTKDGNKLTIEDIIMNFETDATRSLGEFVSGSSGLYEGDCEDFARSLLAAYELVKDRSGEKSSEDKFMEKLHSGLKRYQIIGVDIERHAMNASITYIEDFSVAIIELIDPMIFSYYSPKSALDDDLMLVRNGIGIASRQFRDSGKKDSLILRLYTSSSCYAFPQEFFLK